MPVVVCETYMLQLFKSAFASVCLSLKGFNLFYIPVPEEVGNYLFRIVPLGEVQQVSGKRSSCGSKSSRVF
jgi:hypothetical protein